MYQRTTDWEDGHINFDLEKVEENLHSIKKASWWKTRDDLIGTLRKQE